jgi:CubicO group peptidase (beta-lactamase class C family)
VRDLLERARKERAFSGAAYAVGRADHVLEQDTLGTLAWESEQQVDDATLFDLASLTKPIVAIAAMVLLQQGVLRLDDTIASLLPDWRASDKGSITLEQLLTHSSGIPGQQPLYWTVQSANEMLDAVRHLPLRFAPGTQVEYTSQGFMVLGRILEEVSGMRLDKLLLQTVFDPLEMRATCFAPTDEEQRYAAATEFCAWRGRMVQGQVHDENAVVMGGVAGHAGLFSTLGDMIRLCRMLLSDGTPVLSRATVDVMTRARTSHLNLARCLGWQGKDDHGSPGGDLFSNRSYGHTGFTGTSVWLDSTFGLFVVLLTNRVHPTRQNEAIHRLRPLVHNASVAAWSGRVDA